MQISQSVSLAKIFLKKLKLTKLLMNSFQINNSRYYCQINNSRYIYIYIFFFSKQIKSFHLCENEIKKTTTTKIYLLLQNAKCTSVNKNVSVRM